VLVTVEQLPAVLARLRGGDAPLPASGTPSRDAVAESLAGYDEMDGDSDEDAWSLTDRE